MDAEYEWSYIAIGGPSPGFKAGAAKMDAASLRTRPEISVELSENLCLFVNGMVQASAWMIDEDDDAASPDYPGVDMYSAVTAGIRYSFDI